MASGIQTLSEKEKETLRLLVDGHDAKSMARHLGLSVHTVNERLRDARRKMAVSSSREAARQLREVERETPEYSADRLLGDAGARPVAEDLPLPVAAPRIPRGAGWVAGALLMSLGLALFAALSLSDSADAPAAPAAATAASPAAESDAARAARRWLERVDAGDWTGSWDATGQAFKSLNSTAKWTKVSRAVRTPLGALVSRRLVSEENVPAPPYGYQLVKFRTDYANRAGALETVSLVRENGDWRVVGVTVE